MTSFLRILEEASTPLLSHQTTIRHESVRKHKAKLDEEVKTDKRSFQINALSSLY